MAGLSACSIRVRGAVQGVGFRPFVFRLARAHALAGWVLNAEDGVEIFLEGAELAWRSFVRDLEVQPPVNARIAAIDVRPAGPAGLTEFSIRDSQRRERPTVHISPDLPVCGECLQELFDPQDSRFLYPYINCTNCGPRYTVIRGLPYDRPNTTMKDWPLDDFCSYHDPENRRFHAQPVACPACGPHFFLRASAELIQGDAASIRRAADLLSAGAILSVKGIGGYHLACDARSAASVATLRERKYRKEKPFALMARDLEVARSVVHLNAEAEALLTSVARPIVLAPAMAHLPGVAPDNDELGIMLPYAPLHHLLFAAGAPAVLVLTSANRSSEPIAYQDDEAQTRLAGIADAFLVGERPIARRVDDSVARVGVFGPTILRRARGYSPSAVTTLPVERPVLALGGDLKSTITLVVAGQAFVSQHLGDLDHYESFVAFQQTIRDLVSMYEVRREDLLVVHDAHPEYVSTIEASELGAAETRAVQHHRAHLASVLAEHQAWDQPVVGVSCDGTGYGDDGTIWGGEIFVGSAGSGFERVAHLRPAALAGGDAAAQHPVQAAAGFLAQIDGLPPMADAPFLFPARFESALELIANGLRTFPTTSVGRLFDAAAALLGFTRAVTFEGQGAMWLEHQARAAISADAYPFPFADGELDFRPLLTAVLEDRLRGRRPSEIARAFQRGIAHGLGDAVNALCESSGTSTVVLSGGVFQNELLLADLKLILERERLQIWTNHAVPANDGGISLGQATLAALGQFAAPCQQQSRSSAQPDDDSQRGERPIALLHEH